MNSPKLLNNSESILAYRRGVVISNLLEAYETAMELHCPVWELAVQLDEIRRSGGSDTALRWFICQGFVEHGLEMPRSNQGLRCFRQASSLRFTPASAFILTEAGAKMSPEEVARNAASTPGTLVSAIPHYSTGNRTLYFDGEIIKCFRVPAANQELVLIAFEEEHWPTRIPDPLPGKADMDAKRRLNETVKQLNATQRNRRIQFRGDGTGMGVMWEKLS